MKKTLKIFLPLVLCFFCFAVQVNAVQLEYEHYQTEYFPVSDNADLIDNDDKLSEKLVKIGKKYDMHVAVVTVDKLGDKTAEEFADDFFDRYFGNDGIILVLSMEYRDWAISTKGKGIRAFTDYGCDYIFEQMKSKLAENDFEDAFDIFAEQCEAFLKQAENGKPYDINNKVKNSTDYLIIAVIAFVCGVLAAFIVTSIMKNQLKSVGFQRNADSYIENSSVRVTQSHDMFLYKTLSKTKRESNNSSSNSSSRGGGSSTHVSSSGSTHGGRSGKF